MPANFPYYNVVDQIYHAPWAAQKLARLELLRESIDTLWPSGHPTRLISVAGTSGKGSTSRFLETALGTAGSAGAFMSPHIFDYRERFSLNGEFAAQDDITRLWESRLAPHCARLALRSATHAHSFHEVGILMALSLFDEHAIEWAAVEAGLGGRYDQTRALDVEATVLTNVGSDHAHLLGSEPWQRVLDKAGIARAGVPFFTSEVDAENLGVIEAVCRNAGAPLHKVGAGDAAALSTKLEALPGESSVAEPLIDGAHQRTNAALALATARHLLPDFDEARVLAAFRDARLLGRFWPIEQGPHAGLYIDIAHNVEKVRALAEQVAAKFPARGKLFVVGVSGVRDPQTIFAALAPLAKAVIVTHASHRGQDPASVRAAIAALGVDIPLLAIAEPHQALDVAQSLAEGDDLILLTGSTYMIGQALNDDPYLSHLSNTFGWRTRGEATARGSVEMVMPPAQPPIV